MKVTNISTKRIYLKDLKFVPQAQTEGRRGEDRYLDAGASVYLPDTSEVLRSAHYGDIRKFKDNNYLTVNDTVNLAAVGNPGDNIVINHQLGYPPTVTVLKQNGATWVDATGIMNIVHHADVHGIPFTQVTVSNTIPFAVTYLIKVG
jgi:hypothetical protein